MQAGFFRDGTDADGHAFPRADAASTSTWLYPKSPLKPFRDYQYALAKTALTANTLCSLPTGMGKTLIAAVVMYNHLRWFPDGIVVFMAPTRPLVQQQIRACCKAVGLIANEVAHLITGAVPPAERRRMWSARATDGQPPRRLFFCTPHCLRNDLASQLVDGRRIVCTVYDEAHHAASKGHAYAEVALALRKLGARCRVLGLSATAGPDLASVQRLIDALSICRVETRTEADSQLARYMNEKTIEIRDVPEPRRGGSFGAGGTLRAMMLRPAAAAFSRLQGAGLLPPGAELAATREPLLLQAAQKVEEHERRARSKAGMSAMFGGRGEQTARELSAAVAMLRRLEMVASMAERTVALAAEKAALLHAPAARPAEGEEEEDAEADDEEGGAMNSDESDESDDFECGGQAAGTEAIGADGGSQLPGPGLNPATLAGVAALEDRISRALTEVDDCISAAEALGLTREDATYLRELAHSSAASGAVPSGKSHAEWRRVAPKISSLSTLLHDHFRAMPHSRVIAFVAKRVTVSALCDQLTRTEDMRGLVRAAAFVGRGKAAGDAAGAGAAGMDQAEQRRVLREFTRGSYNVLVATCVAEEGLDIAEVDLIVCFDTVSSPIRLVQRLGRTGRAREGRCALLLTPAEKAAYWRTVEKADSLAAAVDSGRGLTLRRADQLPAVLPPGCPQEGRFFHITSQPDTPPSVPRAPRTEAGAGAEPARRPSLLGSPSAQHGPRPAGEGASGRVEYGGAGRGPGLGATAAGAAAGAAADGKENLLNKRPAEAINLLDLDSSDDGSESGGDEAAGVARGAVGGAEPKGGDVSSDDSDVPLVQRARHQKRKKQQGKQQGRPTKPHGQAQAKPQPQPLPLLASRPEPEPAAAALGAATLPLAGEPPQRGEIGPPLRQVSSPLPAAAAGSVERSSSPSAAERPDESDAAAAVEWRLSAPWDPAVRLSPKQLAACVSGDYSRLPSHMLSDY